MTASILKQSLNKSYRFIEFSRSLIQGQKEKNHQGKPFIFKKRQ